MIRSSALVLFLAFGTSVVVSAQNNCTASIPTGTCLAPSPVLVWCQGNNSESTCQGGTSKAAFYTTTPAAGSWTDQFEGLDAASILDSDSIPRDQVDPYGGIGPKNSDGVGQYLEVAGGYVQAFDRATGNGVFSHRTGTAAIPQSLAGLFYPGGSSYCGIGSADAIATYDRIDGVFVAGNIFHPGNTGNYYCIGVSASVGGVPANNLAGYNGESYWNVYAYNLAPAIPQNPEGQTYFPDYERFGTWQDGFYLAFDLEDPATNDVNIVGFEVCKLDKAAMIAGLSTNPPVCYTYIPGYVTGTGGTNASLIHTLLPADFEGDNSIPSNTKGEYFLALVNPSNSGTNNQCSQSPCTSDRLAFWTWSEFENGAGPTYITFPAHPFTPGCYNPAHPWLTVCIPEPYGGLTDSVGDRLMSRLAYRYLTGTKTGEFLAVAHTIEENATTLRTGIQYYQIAIGSTKPTISLIGDLQDTEHLLFASVPSVAMDKNGDLGIAFTVIGNSSVSEMNYDPSPYFITVASNGLIDSPTQILSNSGLSGQDETDEFWGEYISVGSDPDDDLTFWALNEYMNGNQISNCSAILTSGCTWATRVFTCKKGSGC
jgi:hypothetical protein